MTKISTETRVGFFVLSGVALLVAFLLILGDFSLQRTMKQYVDFAFSGGLQVGAPVKISGIKIGRIASLDLLPGDASPKAAATTGSLGQVAKPLVRATLSVNETAGHLFTASARLAVGTEGLIGEPYLELMPGKAGDAVLPAKSAIRGVDAVKFHVMFVQAAAVLQAIGGFVGVEDDLGLDEVGKAVASLVTTLNHLIGERKEILGQGLADLAGSAGDLRAILKEVKRFVGVGRPLDTAIVDGQASISLVRKELPFLMEMIKGSLTSVEALSGKANAAISDELVHEMVNSLRETTKRVEQLTKDVQSMVTLMKRGEGTVGGLVKDPQIYDDVKELMRDLKRNPWKVLWRD